MFFKCLFRILIPVIDRKIEKHLMIIISISLTYAISYIQLQSPHHWPSLFFLLFLFILAKKKQKEKILLRSVHKYFKERHTIRYNRVKNGLVYRWTTESLTTCCKPRNYWDSLHLMYILFSQNTCPHLKHYVIVVIQSIEAYSCLLIFCNVTEHELNIIKVVLYTSFIVKKRAITAIYLRRLPYKMTNDK